MFHRGWCRSLGLAAHPTSSTGWELRFPPGQETLIFQKPLSPAHVAMMVEANRDTIAGCVLNAADVAQVKSPRELYEAHGLGFPGGG